MYIRTHIIYKRPSIIYSVSKYYIYTVCINAYIHYILYMYVSTYMYTYMYTFIRDAFSTKLIRDVASGMR